MLTWNVFGSSDVAGSVATPWCVVHRREELVEAIRVSW